MPSLWPEPFGLVGPEANRHGVPVVAFATGGIPEWLHDGVNGCLAPGDPPTAAGGLADALIRCIRSLESSDALTRGALAAARSRRDDQHLDALLEILGGAAHGPIASAHEAADPVRDSRPPRSADRGLPHGAAARRLPDHARSHGRDPDAGRSAVRLVVAAAAARSPLRSLDAQSARVRRRGLSQSPRVGTRPVAKDRPIHPASHDRRVPRLEPLYYEALAAELARTGERLSAQFILFHQRLVPRLLAFASRRADRVFCLNSRERDFIVSRGWAEPARVRVVPNGVERDLFREGRIYAARASRLLFTGQWLRAKGIRYLVNAFESLASRHPAIELTCVGTGAGGDAVRRDFAPSMRGRVRVLPGSIARSWRKSSIGRTSSCSPPCRRASAARCSRRWPRRCLSSRRPPALPRTCSGHGENALVVPIADAPALIDSIDRLIDRTDLRQQLGGRARATARRV